MMSLKLVTLFTFFLSCRLADQCLAAEKTAAGTGQMDSLSETASLFSAIFKVGGALAVVIGLMVLLIFFIKKSGISQGLGSDSSLIKIMETRMVAPKRYIAIVEIAEQLLAVGITEHNITMLTPLNDQVKEQIATTHPKPSSNLFAKLLNKSMQGKSSKHSS